MIIMIKIFSFICLVLIARRDLLKGRERAYPNDNYLSGDGKSMVWNGHEYYSPNNRSWHKHHTVRAIPRDRIPDLKEFQHEDQWRDWQKETRHSGIWENMRIIWLVWEYFITGRNEVVAKVLHLVISTGLSAKPNTNIFLNGCWKKRNSGTLRHTQWAVGKNACKRNLLFISGWLVVTELFRTQWALQLMILISGCSL